VVRVLGCRVSKVAVEGHSGFSKDLEVFEFIRAEFLEENWGVREGKGGAYALHYGSERLCSFLYKLGVGEGAVYVGLGVIDDALAEGVIGGVENTEEVVVLSIGKVRAVEGVGDVERGWEGS
jgi:hypothetical protein